MNLGNLIKNKISQSSFGSMKEFYEAMKNIIGEECCAYNTFTDSLNKNKSLSDRELLTISVLLDIDLNKIAMHYVNSMKNFGSELKTSECYKVLKDDILTILNIESNEKCYNCTFKEEDITLINNKIYALSIGNRDNTVLSYEIEIKKSKDDYVIKLKLISYFDYLKSILLKNNITIEEFKEMDLFEKVSIMKDESKIYYEMFPKEKSEDKLIELSEFNKSIIKECIEDYIKKYGDEMYLDKDKYIYDNEGDKFERYIILKIIQEEITSNKKVNYSIPEELEKYTVNLFESICLEKLEVWTNEE